MARISTEAFVVFLVFVDVLAFAVFLRGFFPIKSSVPGYARHPVQSEPSFTSHNSTDPLSALPHPYDKVVIVLIDALRTDFVLPGPAGLPRMEYVESLIQNNDTLSYIAKAHPPTVTMPRIKAMTTGGIPGFIDVVMNFNTQSLLEDNVITQMHRQGLKLVFYGDDTWIRLYPDHFVRTDGTSSFFVTDYTEVDYNVSRHLGDELTRHDWDVLILHYLGLDHIGHLAGPYSPLVKPKLKEMDEVIKHILHALFTEYSESRSLLLLCGDHGMSDQGSHGGSSPSETATPLIFIDPKWLGGKGMAYTGHTINQIDIAPTLALCLGIPIPQNNLGTVITDVLRSLNPRDRLRAAYINAKQLLMVLKQNIEDYKRDPAYHQLQRAEQSHSSWLQASLSKPNSPALNQLADKILDQYMSGMSNMREKISGMLLCYDVHAMGAGIFVLYMVLFTLLLLSTEKNVLELLPSSIFVAAIAATFLVFTHVSLCTSEAASTSLCTVQGSLVVVFFIFVSFINTSIWLTWIRTPSYKTCWLYVVKLYRADLLYKLLICGTVGHTMSLLSSSFVEEEHQTWYFLTVSAHILYMCRLYNKTHQASLQDTTDVQHCATHTVKRDGTDKSQFAINEEKFLWTDQRTNKFCERKKDTPIIKTTDLLLSLTFLVLCRIARAWNQTGDKWSHLPDIGDWLTCPENVFILSLLTVVGMVSSFVHVCSSAFSFTTNLLFILGSVGVYCYRAATGVFWCFSLYTGISKGILEARCVYAVAVLMTLGTFHKCSKPDQSASDEEGCNIPNNSGDAEHLENPHKHVSLKTRLSLSKTFWAQIQTVWILLMLLLLRPHNIMLVAMVIWQEFILRYFVKTKLILDTEEIGIMYYWMGQAGFYYQGNSNSISTVDVSAGYIGLDTYQPVIIGLLMALSSYAIPIYWLISLIRVICDTVTYQPCTKARLKMSFLTILAVVAICRALPMAVYTVLVTVQRYHLFVWTVFSPKLLYEGMHTVVVFVLVTLIATAGRFS